MSLPANRKRYPTEIVVGGLSRIFGGLFGSGSPASQLSSPSQVIGDTRREGGIYHMHEGDLFTPGTGNWVLDPSQEAPIQTVWGHGFLCGQTPNPFQAPQVYSNPTVVTRGIGGLIAGQMINQPLLDTAPEQGG